MRGFLLSYSLLEEIMTTLVRKIPAAVLLAGLCVSQAVEAQDEHNRQGV